MRIVNTFEYGDTAAALIACTRYEILPFGAVELKVVPVTVLNKFHAPFLIRHSTLKAVAPVTAVQLKLTVEPKADPLRTGAANGFTVIVRVAEAVAPPPSVIRSSAA